MACNLLSCCRACPALYFVFSGLPDTQCPVVVSLTPRHDRIRHVKCDEEKPTCSKCRSTGRVCDGYKTKQSASKSPEYNSGQLFPVDATIKALSIIPGLTMNIAGTDRERRSFAFFCYQTGQQLSTALNITQTHQLILQASHCDEAVRSAVIALGSIGERLSINNLLTLENEEANACHDFAHLQYYKALKRLRERISNDSEGTANLAIILCFLFTIFEFLQGNDAGSLIHLRSGLNILRRDHGSLPMGLQTVSPDQDPLKLEILRTFSIMDMQATVWLGLKTFQAPIMIPLDGPGDAPAYPDQFSSADEASEFLNDEIVSTDHFLRLVAAYDSTESPNQMPPEVHPKKEKLLVRLKKWPVALGALTEKLRGENDTEMSQRVAVLKMNYETTLMRLTTCLQPFDQQIYADHEPEFRLIVGLAKSVIGPTDDLVTLGVQYIVAANNADINLVPMFSFYAGVIRPLYFTAIKCQNLRICREAIALLSSSPWREGAWDSAAMARIAARRFQEVEERCMDTNLPMMDHVAHGYGQRRQFRQM